MKRTSSTLGLLVASVVVLHLGRYVQYDDTSGSGSNEWVTALGPLAFVAAAASVVTALPEARSRRALGVAWCVTGAAIVVGAVLVDGFRFIWSDSDGELVLFVPAVVLGGLGLVGSAAPRRAGVATPTVPGLLRLVLYVAGTALLSMLAFGLGAAHFDATRCDGPEVTDCDLAGLEGLIWAAVTVVLGLLGSIVNETRLLVRNRRRPPTPVSPPA